MAYVNSGIEMKTSQYDWKIIGFIILLLVAVCALVTIKLLFPDMTQEKLFSVLSSSSPAVIPPVRKMFRQKNQPPPHPIR